MSTTVSKAYIFFQVFSLLQLGMLNWLLNRFEKRTGSLKQFGNQTDFKSILNVKFHADFSSFISEPVWLFVNRFSEPVFF
jgi:hypothetical protein